MSNRLVDVLARTAAKAQRLFIIQTALHPFTEDGRRNTIGSILIMLYKVALVQFLHRAAYSSRIQVALLLDEGDVSLSYSFQES